MASWNISERFFSPPERSWLTARDPERRPCRKLSVARLDPLLEGIAVAAGLAHLVDQIVEGDARAPRPGTGTPRTSPSRARSSTGKTQQLVTADLRRTGGLVLALAHQHVAQRRLAGAVRAHEGMDLAERDLEVDAVEDLEVAERGVQVGDLQSAVVIACLLRRCGPDQM